MNVGYGADGYPEVAGASKESALFFDARTRQRPVDPISHGFPTGRPPIRPDFTQEQQGVPNREATEPPMDAQNRFQFADPLSRAPRPRPPLPRRPSAPTYPSEPRHAEWAARSPWEIGDWEKFTADAWTDAALIKSRSKTSAKERWEQVRSEPCTLHNKRYCDDFECLEDYHTQRQALFRTAASEMEISCVAGIKALAYNTTRLFPLLGTCSGKRCV